MDRGAVISALAREVEMARNFIGVVAGLAVWLFIAIVAGLFMRETWPAYAIVADAMTFTLPMMIARLSIGAFATVSMGFVTARIAQSAVARLIPGLILLIVFIPEHVMLWDKFPIWYHLSFLASLVPLTYVGNSFARGAMRQHPVMS
jgi:succinyl-CoA synthetase alpha subunit